jgi:hypothetical protein
MRVALIVFALLIAFAVGFYFGGEYGEFRTLHRAWNRSYEDDCRLIVPLLVADPAFRRVDTLRYPVLGTCLAGEVDSQEDLRRLHTEMLRLFGESRVEHMMQSVKVGPMAGPTTAPDGSEADVSSPGSR